MAIKMEDIFINGKVNAELVKDERWLYYLAVTDNVSVNFERIRCVSEITGRETLEYVLKTLERLEEMQMDSHEKYILRQVLQWSEVSKGGTKKQREEWEKKGYPLDIHNLASAEIYLDECTDTIQDAKLIYALIKTHGVVGQNIRGEVNYNKNYPLIEMMSNMMNEIKDIKIWNIEEKKTKEAMHRMLMSLNECIIGAIDWKLWISVKNDAEDIINSICEMRMDYCLTTQNRMAKLLPVLKDADTDTADLFGAEVFPYFELWYFSSALHPFSKESIVSLFNIILSHDGIQKVSHINFKPLADMLYYDYEGSRHINVYKQRVIEKFLKDGENEHVSIDLHIANRTVMVGFKFSDACGKLIDFCVEAERSGLLTYEKSITVLFDMFGFRRDGYDRLNNEEKYLNTMNDCADSKKSILNYVVGETVVDVGSGGGIMLDMLEKRYPDKTIIGTDISANVNMELERKKRDEGHEWTSMCHNFVEEPLPFKADTIIFSSILHEIYSYTETDNGRFDIESVKQALGNAKLSLNDGGRIIIRDGIKTASNEHLQIMFKDDESYTFFQMFKNDFKGLKDVPREITYMLDGKSVMADVNFIREFMYTYTWGAESYSHEVQEQFGYFTLDEFVEFMTGGLGMDVIQKNEFLEDGYYEHLKEHIGLHAELYPNSNCIVVAQLKNNINNPCSQE